MPLELIFNGPSHYEVLREVSIASDKSHCTYWVNRSLCSVCSFSIDAAEQAVVWDVKMRSRTEKLIHS